MIIQDRANAGIDLVNFRRPPAHPQGDGAGAHEHSCESQNSLNASRQAGNSHYGSSSSHGLQHEEYWVASAINRARSFARSAATSQLSSEGSTGERRVGGTHAELAAAEPVLRYSPEAPPIIAANLNPAIKARNESQTN